MSSEYPILVLEDDDLVVYYRSGGTRQCALTLFSQDARHDLSAALGAIRQASILAGYVAQHVRYRPAQRQDGVDTPAHIILNYNGVLDTTVRLRLAQAFVRAIQILGG